MVVLLSWIFEHSAGDCAVYPLSFIELTLGFASMRDARFPFWNPQASDFEMQFLSIRFERPTLAQLLSIVRSAVLHFVGGVDCGDIVCDGCNKIGLGICRPMSGLFVRLRPSMVQHCSGLAQNFFKTRQYRSAGDIAPNLAVVAQTPETGPPLHCCCCALFFCVFLLNVLS